MSDSEKAEFADQIILAAMTFLNRAQEISGTTNEDLRQSHMPSAASRQTRTVTAGNGGVLADSLAKNPGAHLEIVSEAKSPREHGHRPRNGWYPRTTARRRH